MSTSLHRLLVDHYASLVPGTKRHGFEPFARKLEARLGYVEMDGESAFPLGFSPDAWRVDRKGKQIWLVEAEVTSRITAKKWEAINEYRLRLVEYDDWDVWVHIVDRAGAVFSVNTPLMRRFDAEDFELFARAPAGRHVWIPSAATQPAWRATEWPHAHWLTADDLRRMGGFEDILERNAIVDAEWALRSPFTGTPLVGDTSRRLRTVSAEVSSDCDDTRNARPVRIPAVPSTRDGNPLPSRVRLEGGA